MAKQGSIKHYRQTGSAKAPPSLPFGELAVAKDGTLFVGNDKNLPVQTGNGIELLWENASPTSAFPVQKLTLIKPCTAFLVEYMAGGVGNKCNSAWIVPGNSYILTAIAYTAAGISISGGRYATATATDIDFSFAFTIGGVSNNALCVPLRIMGMVS